MDLASSSGGAHSDYQELSADRVVRLAHSFAQRHHIEVRSTRAALALSVQSFRVGIAAVGQVRRPVSLTPKARAFDPVMVASLTMAKGWDGRGRLSDLIYATWIICVGT